MKTDLLFSHRRPRTWLNAQGLLAEPVKPKLSPELKTVHWSAHVIDATTQTQLDDYPSLQGDVQVDADTDLPKIVQQTYIQTCQMLDDMRPDIAALKQRINTGIWQLVIETAPT